MAAAHPSRYGRRTPTSPDLVPARPDLIFRGESRGDPFDQRGRRASLPSTRPSFGRVLHEIGHDVDDFDRLLTWQNGLLDQNMEQAFAEHQSDLPVRIG